MGARTINSAFQEIASLINQFITIMRFLVSMQPTQTNPQDNWRAIVDVYKKHDKLAANLNSSNREIRAEDLSPEIASVVFHSRRFPKRLKVTSIAE